MPRSTVTPALLPEQFETVIRTYLSELTKLGKDETRREIHFYNLVRSLFSGLNWPAVDDLVKGVRTRTGRIVDGVRLRGTADNVTGRIITEFEGNLKVKAKIVEAERQLREYAAGQWAKESSPRPIPFIGVACDGDILRRYTISANESGTPQLLSQAVYQMSAIEPADVYFLLAGIFSDQKRPVSGQRLAEELAELSPSFEHFGAMFLEAWRRNSAAPDYKVLFDSWRLYLRKLYSDETVSEPLFVAHSYLVTVAKLICFRMLFPDETLSPDGLRDVISGDRFRTSGIENYIEDDFFAWVRRDQVWPEMSHACQGLLRVIDSFEWTHVTEDVLKPLYQNLVDPATRHELGEFYTPDWLAEVTIDDVLSEDPRLRALDPGCGSGTFVQKTIQKKIALLGSSMKPNDLLKHILGTVIAFDINPIAVVITKTNYILAISGLLRAKGRKAISLPVYLADALRARSIELKGLSTSRSLRDYDVVVELDEAKEKRPVTITSALLVRREMFRELIDTAHEYALTHKGIEQLIDKDFRMWAEARLPVLAPDSNEEKTKVFDGLLHIAKQLHHFIRIGRDSIWAFVLNNRLLPIILSSYDIDRNEDNRVDLLIGNPPWITLQGLDPEYQEYLREAVREDYHLLGKKDGKNVTHVELATLFWVRCADLYLKKGGRVAFVMPRSIFTADHNRRLRVGTGDGGYRSDEDVRNRIVVQKVWDMMGVKNLFKMPTAVLFGHKKSFQEDAVKYPIPAVEWSGTIPQDKHNASWADVDPLLARLPTKIDLTKGREVWVDANDIALKMRAGRSPYFEQFTQGATIVPRAFWFIDEAKLAAMAKDPLGVDWTCPKVESAEDAVENADKIYEGVRIRGRVESEFLYVTLLSRDLFPFAYGAGRLLVLPIVETKDGIAYANDDTLVAKPGLRGWLTKTAAVWNERRGNKAGKMTMLENLNYQQKLTDQKPEAKWVVLYNKAGSHMCSAVVSPERLLKRFNQRWCLDGETQFEAKGFVASHTTYRCYFDRRQPADYLCAMLNSPIVDELLKPMQSTGLGGPRDIEKKVLELPIPTFDVSIAAHSRLAELSAALHRKFDSEDYDGVSHGSERHKMRVDAESEFAEIDKLARKLLLR